MHIGVCDLAVQVRSIRDIFSPSEFLEKKKVSMEQCGLKCNATLEMNERGESGEQVYATRTHTRQLVTECKIGTVRQSHIVPITLSAEQGIHVQAQSIGDDKSRLKVGASHDHRFLTIQELQAEVIKARKLALQNNKDVVAGNFGGSSEKSLSSESEDETHSHRRPLTALDLQQRQKEKEKKKRKGKGGGKTGKKGGGKRAAGGAISKVVPGPKGIWGSPRRTGKSARPFADAAALEFSAGGGCDDVPERACSPVRSRSPASSVKPLRRSSSFASGTPQKAASEPGTAIGSCATSGLPHLYDWTEVAHGRVESCGINAVSPSAAGVSGWLGNLPLAMCLGGPRHSSACAAVWLLVRSTAC